jgi:guanine deaminase
MPSTKHLLSGQTLAFESSPFSDGPDAARHEARGAVVVWDGKIVDLGTAEDMRAAHPDAAVTDYGDKLIMAGFVDAHVHYPQTGIVASWGKRLIDWLNSYTFPEEIAFSDPAYADKIADLYFDIALSHGVTTCASYCTIHPASVDAFFTAARARGLRSIGGKTCMDRNAPDGLRDTPHSAYDDSKALIAKWHGVDRLSYAVTPRFSPTSTPEQLEMVGALWAEHRDCLMQTHLSEQTDEVEWVKSLYPNARDYLDTYEQAGLIGKGAVMGHSIYLTERERAVMAETGTAVAHCPTSNTFIGSGLCDVGGLKTQGISTGLGTDTGGGSSFSMLRTMAAAYEIGQLRGNPLHPAHLLWLATVGSAETLCVGDKIGNLEVGKEADLIVIGLASITEIAQRSARAKDFWEAVFPTIMMGDDRAIHSVWANGKPLITK